MHTCYLAFKRVTAARSGLATRYKDQKEVPAVINIWYRCVAFITSHDDTCNTSNTQLA